MENLNLPTPLIQVNDQNRRVSTFGALVPLPLESQDNNPNNLRPGIDYYSLRGFLRKCQINHADRVSKFWPDQLLRRIMTEERVQEDMESVAKKENIKWDRGIPWYLDKLFPSGTLDRDTANGAENGIEPSADAPNCAGKQYLKLYAILVLCEKQPFLQKFIEAGIHDGDLPFVPCDQGPPSESLKLAPKKDPKAEISCFRDWRSSEIDLFDDSQYQFLIPYFCASDSKAPVKHTRYYDRAIMPWIEEVMDKGEVGGYGIVTCKRIHSECHGFQSLAQVRVGNGLFALKRITSKDIKDFENETKMLSLFSGHHDHLIMLLVSFSWNGHNYLLFPWADCDLDNYWEQKKPPYRENFGMHSRSMEWVSKQILGLTSGLHNIHNPAQLHSLSDMRFGRHGDLKPENILWLQPEDDESDQNGILVIGDLGISAIHREASRSNQPGKKIPHSPNYRPPECDLDGGVISRAFDIWTLGCLFLEMVCWVLGGKDLVNKFSSARAKVLYLGSATNTNIFFDIQKVKDDGHVILVKSKVLSWMSKLHKHPGCTEYLHDLLDIIHGDMIVVLSKNKERIRSGDLLDKIGKLHERVSDPQYGLLPYPRVRTYDPSIGVRAELNENAKERLKTGQHHGRIGVFEGKTARSKTVSEMRDVY